MRLSAIVITKNEEHNIARCLQSLAFADEIIVVDAQSEDRTAEIAADMGAQVHVRPWPGYGAQKNYGREQAQGEWLLFVDADEEVTPALAEAITRAISQPSPDFYWFRVVTVFLGRPLRHLFGHNPRLMRKKSGRWTDAKVHEQVEHLRAASEHELTRESADGTTYRVISLDDEFSQVLAPPLLHHSHPTIASYLAKMHRYTTLDAQQMHATGRHRSGRTVQASWWLPWWLSMRQFMKLLLYRRGILDGWAGLLWCTLSSYYEFEMAQKFNRLHS